MVFKKQTFQRSVMPRPHVAPAKIAKSGKSFETLVAKVPTEVFVGMVNKSGLPVPEARELCQMFKELKG